MPSGGGELPCSGQILEDGSLDFGVAGPFGYFG
jgi:hypothetical protein